MALNSFYERGTANRGIGSRKERESSVKFSMYIFKRKLMAKIHIDYDVIFFEDPETTCFSPHGFGVQQCYFSYTLNPNLNGVYTNLIAWRGGDSLRQLSL